MIEVRTNNKPLYLYKLDWYIHVVYKPVNVNLIFNMIEVRTNNKPLYLYKLDWYIHVVYKPVM